MFKEIKMKEFEKEMLDSKSNISFDVFDNKTSKEKNQLDIHYLAEKSKKRLLGDDYISSRRVNNISLKEGDILWAKDMEFAKNNNYGINTIVDVFIIKEHNEYVLKKQIKKHMKNINMPKQLWHVYKDVHNVQVMNILKEINEDSDGNLFSYRYNTSKLKYFDAHGIWGMSSRDISYAWFISGVGKNIAYFKNIILSLVIMIEKHGRVDNSNIYMLPNKFLSIKDIVNIFELTNSLKYNNITISKRLATRLASLSYLNREIIVAQLISRYSAIDYEHSNYEDDDRSRRDYRYFPIYSQKHIDWTVLTQPVWVKVSKIKDKAYQWFWYTNKLGVDITGYNKELLRRLPSPFNFNKKQLQFLVDNYVGFITNLHPILTYLSILALYGSNINSVKKVIEINNESIGSILTNVEIILSIDINIRKELAELILKDNRYIELSYNYVAIRGVSGHKPKSYEEAMNRARLLSYDDVLLYQVAKICSEHNVSQKIFEKVQNNHIKLLEKSNKLLGQYTSLPLNIEVNSAGYKVSFMDKLDPRGWLLGEITNCCQTIGSAGDSCVKSGMTDYDKGFLLIEDGKKILAQSWVWVDKYGNLVLDSIESKGLSDIQLKKVTDAITEWSIKAKKTIFIKDVFIGVTKSGITNYILELLDTDGKKYKHKPVKYNGYMDGQKQIKI